MNFSFVRSALVLITLTVSLPFTPSAQAQSGNYTLDASHTSVIFSIQHLGISKTYGTFRKVSGKFTLDAAKPAAGSFEVLLDVASIDTNDAKRDEHLKAADFFNAKQFPDITFKATRVEQTADELKLTGDFTMHGVTKKITLPLKKGGEAKDPFGNTRVGYSGELNLKRSDYGMKTMVGPIGDEVSIDISFEGILQK